MAFFSSTEAPQLVMGLYPNTVFSTYGGEVKNAHSKPNPPNITAEPSLP